MRDYFARQIALFETMLAELGALEDDDKDIEDREDLIALQATHDKKIRSLDQEFSALRREWDATQDIAGPDRDAMRLLARKADTLCVEVQALLSRGARLAGEQADALRQSIDQIRQGKDVLGKYGTGGAQAPSYIDRKA